MKFVTFIVFLLLAAFAAQAQSAEPTYREAVQAARDRSHFLEMKRWEKGKLAPEEEKELLEISHRLKTEDPVATLQQELQIKLDRLLETSSPKSSPADATGRERELSAAEVEQISTIREFLAILSDYSDPCESRAEAGEIATAMRKFIARGDVQGANAWKPKR